MRSTAARSTLPGLLGALLWVVFSASPAARADLPVRGETNLDDAPWRFTKLLNQRNANLSQGRPVTVSESAEKLTFTIDLGEAW